MNYELELIHKKSTEIQTVNCEKGKQKSNIVNDNKTLCMGF